MKHISLGNIYAGSAVRFMSDLEDILSNVPIEHKDSVEIDIRDSEVSLSYTRPRTAEEIAVDAAHRKEHQIRSYYAIKEKYNL